MAADVLISIVAVVIVLGIMVLVHEWGHFMAAKLFGVRVEIFSLGFGPRLWGRRRGATDYRVSALPVGGYVKMAGDNPSEERSGRPDEFLSKPRWQRAIIAVAGPVMNILMAVVIVAVLYTVGMPEPAYFDRPAEVGGVAHDSPAERAGISPGDRIVEINGVKDPTWEKVAMQIQLADSRKPLSVVIEREGQLIPLTVPVGSGHGAADEFATLGYPREPVIVGRVTPGQPADRAGLKPNDQILSLDGKSVLSQLHFSNQIQQLGGRPASVVIQRGDRRMTLTLRPTYGDPGDGRPRWQIGILFSQENALRSYPLPDALKRSISFNLRQVRQILNVVTELFQGKVSIKQLAGPVGIAHQSGQYIRLGPLPFFYLMAIISLNLAVLNLLPIPILDGGHILMLTVEGAMRRDLSVTVKERFVTVGMVFLLVIFAIVMYNDVLRLLPSR